MLNLKRCYTVCTYALESNAEQYANLYKVRLENKKVYNNYHLAKHKIELKAKIH